MLVPAAMVLIQSFQPPLWRFTCSRIKPKTFVEAGRRRWSARALRCAASRRARKLLGSGVAVVKLMTLEEIVIDIGRSGRIALERPNSLAGMMEVLAGRLGHLRPGGPQSKSWLR